MDQPDEMIRCHPVCGLDLSHRISESDFDGQDDFINQHARVSEGREREEAFEFRMGRVADQRVVEEEGEWDGEEGHGDYGVADDHAREEETGDALPGVHVARVGA